MPFWQFLNQWWNLPFLVMLGLVGVFFALQAFGLAAHAGSSEHELDLDGDGVPDHDLDHDADLDAAQDADGDHDAEHDGEPSGGHGLADFLGVGRVPFMAVWLTLFIFSGFGGILLNRIAQVKLGGYPAWFFPLSLLGSLGLGATAVRLLARQLQKLVDLGARGAAPKRRLAGQPGVVASPQLDAAFGEVRVRDDKGNELIVHGRLAAGERALKQGDEVVLVELEQDSGLFTVAALKH